MILESYKANSLCSVTQSCPTLCNPMDCSTPGFPVLHHLPELAQTHVCPVGDAIQPSPPLSSPSPALNLSQHQGFFLMSQYFASGSQSIGVSASASVFLMISFRMDWFDLLAVQGPLESLLQYHSSKHQFFSIQVSFWSNSHIHT